MGSERIVALVRVGVDLNACEVVLYGADVSFDEVEVDCVVVGGCILAIMTYIFYLKRNHEVTDNVCAVVSLAHATVDVLSDVDAVTSVPWFPEIFAAEANTLSPFLVECEGIRIRRRSATRFLVV